MKTHVLLIMRGDCSKSAINSDPRNKGFTRRVPNHHKCGAESNTHILQMWFSKSAFSPICV